MSILFSTVWNSARPLGNWVLGRSSSSSRFLTQRESKSSSFISHRWNEKLTPAKRKVKFSENRHSDSPSWAKYSCKLYNLFFTKVLICENGALRTYMYSDMCDFVGDTRDPLVNFSLVTDLQLKTGSDKCPKSQIFSPKSANKHLVQLNLHFWLRIGFLQQEVFAFDLKSNLSADRSQFELAKIRMKYTKMR